MKCPVDNNDMIVVENKHIELDYCVICCGVWFDCGELELMLESIGSGENKSCTDSLTRESAQTTESKRKCPICGRKMDKVWLGGEARVLADSCPVGDGLWFDGGELHKVLAEGGWSNEDVIAFLGDTFRADAAQET